MIKSNTTYTITVTEEQLRDFYHLMNDEKKRDGPYMTIDRELRPLYHEVATYLGFEDNF